MFDLNDAANLTGITSDSSRLTRSPPEEMEVCSRKRSRGDGDRHNAAVRMVFFCFKNYQRVRIKSGEYAAVFIAYC